MRFRTVLAAFLLLVGCHSPDSEQSPLQADRPLHLEQNLDSATFVGAELPGDLPEVVEWRFDRPQPDWRPVQTMNPNTGPVRVERTSDSLRLTFDESNRNLGGAFVGGIAIDLPEWKGWDRGLIIVRARCEAGVRSFSVGVNAKPGQPHAQNAPNPFEQGVAFTMAANDGTEQTYTLRTRGGGVWRRLGLWFFAESSAAVEILSVAVAPAETEFADAPVGLAALERLPDFTAPRNIGPRPAVYIRAPGRVVYDVLVPESGRLDLGLAVLRADVPVTFRVSVEPSGGTPDTVLEEAWRLQRRAERSLDLSTHAGDRVRLALETDAERAGTVAFFASPTLYAPGRLAVSVLDPHGAPTPVRVLLTDENGGRAPFPGDAIGIMYGANDVAVSHTYLRDGAFYADGEFEVDLQPGTYSLSLSKGIEYLPQQHEIEVAPGGQTTQTFQLERWIDMPSKGWFSADDHIHLRRSPREDPLILKWIAAEDVHVGALLQMGDFWATYFAQYAWGRDGVYQVEDHFLTSGQEEPRTHEIGHTISLGADDFVRFQGQYYYYDRVFDRVHELGGLTGYAHKGISRLGPTGLTLDVLRNKVDFVEILQFGSMRVDAYYHYLDLGYKLTATAGSDFPFGRILIGEPRFYTYVGDHFSFDTWRAALKAGHTFVSSGPIIELTVNGMIPGDELEVTEGSSVSIQARAFGHPGQMPLDNLEIVVHGRVVEQVTAGESGQSTDQLTTQLELPVEHGMWIAARARAEPESSENQAQRVAHTTPVYVTLEGGGFHNPETVAHYIALSESYLSDLEHEIAQPNRTHPRLAWRYREGLEARIAETREVIARLKRQFGLAK